MTLYKEYPMQAIRFNALAAVLVLAGAAAAQAPDKTGLKVDTKAPAFTLKDQNGKDRSLDEFLKKGKVALVFFRSAGW
jgi:cytochrome oxidase Cu insertion factor (SCO1/SenC/PrrC family)